MSEHRLEGCRVLVVEDEYMLADDLRGELEGQDAVVLGPVGSVADALRLIGSEPDIDGAVLDVNLRGEMSFPIADLLTERRIPFVFTTGYDASALPERFGAVVRCEKPVRLRNVVQAIGRAIRA